MYLEEVEAVVEIQTVGKCLLRRKIYQICMQIEKDVLNKPIKRTYLRSYTNAVCSYINFLFNAVSLQVLVMTHIRGTNKKGHQT